ncbi:Mov34/MPN/pad-1 family protein (macronuclear) [Tetrahymena thermophila SB210]|uniref:Mov34/MPN/pad-1 family protein n=1 Tax=Tetrahymena thermophila (strain SB210) TaxID=312017 RepID=I7LUF5_TETTS|nr:Mov34/MPN/pad-1 family protein [Tetrahymena thermophila SB210]EAR92951.1 Mov34/MPN/pad-1 family protein [Tetrahymena thermophila SB210]|eukprot:XP_001013196.1 Mov34/MPN/pad-1 family protein [Tetrahymena thermophila SB210]
MSQVEQKQAIELLAYKKAYLHALKYVKDDVIGVLTGKIENGQITVEDAYPLFHSRVVSPTLETAFELIEGALKKKKQIIVGLYEALSHPYQAKYLSEISTRILEKIQKNLSKQPIALRIYDEDKQDQQEEIQEYHYLTCEGYKFDLKDSKNIDANYEKIQELNPQNGFAKFEIIKNDISQNKHRFIVDFDAHFEDISLDFTNSFL